MVFFYVSYSGGARICGQSDGRNDFLLPLNAFIKEIRKIVFFPKMNKIGHSLQKKSHPDSLLETDFLRLALWRIYRGITKS